MTDDSSTAETESDDTLESAVASFLAEADDAYDEYERGYDDADATLRRLETAVSRLREAADE